MGFISLVLANIFGRLTRSLLTIAGHQVDTAANGQRAIEMVESTAYDLVLTDLGMPNINGWDVAAAVGRLRPDLPVVLVTGWGENVSAERARSGGVCRVLPKPFSRADQLACVEEVLSGQPVIA